jgi:hypothetical protein
LISRVQLQYLSEFLFGQIVLLFRALGRDEYAEEAFKKAEELGLKALAEDAIGSAPGSSKRISSIVDPTERPSSGRISST